MPPQLDAIGVTVADMGRALDFYRRLGFEFSPGAESEDHAESRLPSGLRIMFDTQELMRSLDPAWSPAEGSPRISLALKCATPAEVDSLFTELTTLGHGGTREPWDAFWGQRYASLRDPDGNAVDLFAQL